MAVAALFLSEKRNAMHVALHGIYLYHRIREEALS